MREIIDIIINEVRSTNKIALLFSLFVITKAVGFIPFQIPSFFIYGVMVLVALYCLKKSEHLEFLFVALLIYIVLNILISDILPIFNPWGRLGGFVVMLLCVSPIIQGEYIRQYRRYLFKYFVLLGSILSILSFFCWFIGLNFMSREFVDITKAGNFGGLFVHSMILGPVAGISSLNMIYKFFATKRKLYIILSLCCIGALFLSASRTSFVSLVVSLAVMIYKINIEKSKLVKYIFISILSLTISFPIWQSYTDLMVQKNNLNIETGSVFSSRDTKWNARLVEFRSQPIIGIGFASIDLTLDHVTEGGTVEPGSSWLVVLSMLGVIGFVFVLSIFYKSFRNCDDNEPDRALFLSVLCYFSISMITEGYIFAAGSFMSIFMWTIVGCCYDSKYNDSKEIINETCNI